jgi:glucosyl-3-phosphoglycerate synthase
VENGRTVDVFMNNQKVASTSGILKNGTYSIYVNGIKYKTINFNENSPSNTYYLQVGNYNVRIEIGGPVNSDMEFAPSSKGKFLNFVT